MKVITAARKIDEIIGIDTVGSWEDQEIVQGIVEPAGTAVEYGDQASIPLTSRNASFSAAPLFVVSWVCSWVLWKRAALRPFD